MVLGGICCYSDLERKRLEGGRRREGGGWREEEGGGVEEEANEEGWRRKLYFKPIQQIVPPSADCLPAIIGTAQCDQSSLKN